MPIRYDYPFSELLRPVPVKVGENYVFVCQYTLQSCSECVGFPTSLVSANSESAAQVGCFRDWGVVVAWMWDHHKDIYELKDGRTFYITLGTFLAGKMGVEVHDLPDYCPQPRLRLAAFGGDLTLDEWLCTYRKPAVHNDFYTIKAYLKKREAALTKHRTEGPTITTIMNNTLMPNAVQRIELLAWPALKLYAVRRTDPPGDLSVFTEYSGLTEKELPVYDGEATTFAVFSPGVMTKRQKGVVNKYRTKKPGAATAAATPTAEKKRKRAKKPAAASAAVSLSPGEIARILGTD